MPRFLLIDAERLIREGLKLFLQFNLDAEVTEAATLEEGISALFGEAPDAIVLNLPTASASLLGSIQNIKSVCPGAPILLLGSPQDDFHRIRFLQAGASGYVSRGAQPEELIRAIEMLLTGGTYIPADLSRSLISPDKESSPHEHLSNRELQVFILMASGKTSTEIADQLHLSIKTVSTYKIRITEKTGLSTKYEMAQYAAAHRLL